MCRPGRATEEESAPPPPPEAAHVCQMPQVSHPVKHYFVARS
jgi:hypothetical protein